MSDLGEDHSQEKLWKKTWFGKKKIWKEDEEIKEKL